MRFCLFLFLFSALAHSFSREVCALDALGKDAEDLAQRQSMIHKLAEMPIQYLGGHVRYFNLSKGLPSEQWSKDCRAILVWQTEFGKPLVAGRELQWINYLRTQLKQGKRLLLLENPGFNTDLVYQKGEIQNAYLQLLKEMGFEFKRSWTAQQKAQILDPRACQGESPKTPSPRRWISLQNKSDWQGRCLAQDPSQAASTAPLIWTGSKGALASPGSLIRSGVVKNGKNDDAWFQWHIDPFSFFNEALGLSLVPKWENSLRLGKRIFFAHVDGDGFMNHSVSNPQLWTSQILKDSILLRYPGYPIAISVIGAEVNPEYLGDAQSQKRLLELWRLPQVEASSHTFSHPFVYNQTQKQLFRNSYESYALVLPKHNQNWEYEFKGNTQWLNKIATQAGKQIKTLQWSGNCLPDALALRLSREAGIGNINGGDNRLDRNYASVSGLSPLGFEFRSELQVYAVNSNETIYSEGWTWQYQGLERVIETWQRTGYPRLLKPVNLYFHFYALDHNESLASFRRIFQWLDQNDLFPLELSQYTRIVQNAYKASIDSLGHGEWLLSPTTPLSTIRISTQLGYPNDTDPNLLGYLRQGHLTYLYLEQAKQTLISFGPNKPHSLLVQSANGALSQVKRSSETWQAVFNSFRKGQICFQLPDSKAYTLSVNSKALTQLQNKQNCAELPQVCTQSNCHLELRKIP